jgi:hypothetical protein
MANKTHHQESDLLTLYTSLFLDIPLAETRRRFGLAEEKEVLEMRWKSYDAGMRTLTSAIDTLYRDRFFGRTMDLSLQVLLRWQQLNNAVLGTVFTGVRELAGLPTAAQIEGLRAEIHASTLSHAEPNGHQEVQRTVTRDRLVNGEQKIMQNALRALRHTHPRVTPRQELRSALTSSALDTTESAVPAGDLHDYFEPVDRATTEEPELQPSASPYLDYFEPVADRPTPTSSPEFAKGPATAAPTAVTHARRRATSLTVSQFV